MLTRQLFDRIFPTAGLDPRKYNLVRDRDQLIDALNRILPKYGIDTHLRICAFLGNCGIETDYFKTTVEYASGDAYDTMTGLGNTPERDGDGRLYKGRGLTQTTGKYNYEQLNKKIGKRLGIDFVKNPERLAEVEIAVESACIFWDDHGLNAYADRKEFQQLSGIVNRGTPNKLPLQWPKRNELYSKCLRYIPRDISLGIDLPSNEEPEQPQQLPDAPVVDTPQQSNEPGTADGTADFLVDAVDKNVTPDALKLAGRSTGAKAWRFLVRPLSLFYAALEAGNVAAWLGVAVLIVAIGLMLYWHRNDIKKLVDKLKTKLLS
jgi:putative chitinase